MIEKHLKGGEEHEGQWAGQENCCLELGRAMEYGR